MCMVSKMGPISDMSTMVVYNHRYKTSGWVREAANQFSLSVYATLYLPQTIASISIQCELQNM